MADWSLDRGLDLAEVDVTTPEEVKTFRSEVLAARDGKLMYPLSAYSVLLENRPDMLKLHFRQMNRAYHVEGEGDFRILTATTMLHWYTCHRYGEGIIHEIRGCQSHGASKAQINEILAVAFMHCGPSGFRYVYHAAFDYLATYCEPKHPPLFPAGWAPDASALHTGMDFTTREMSPADRDALFDWYERTIGEVPRSVAFLAKYNSAYLKAWRGKLEGTLKGALPKQLLPYMWLHYNINRGFRDGIREAALLGRAWGMTKSQILHSVTFATGYMAGLDGLYAANDALAELLEEDWPESVSGA